MSTADAPGGADQSSPSQARMLEAAREIWKLRSYGIANDAIMAREGLSRTTFFRLLKIGYEDAGNAAGADTPPIPRVAASQPELRKLGAGTLARRALEASCRSVAFRQHTADTIMLWLNAVLAIHEYGVVGVELPFGRRCLYHDAAGFAAQFGATAEDIDALIDYALLVELEDGGVAMPMHFGLRPKPRVRREPASERRGAGADPRQTGILFSINGGRGESQNGGGIRDSESHFESQNGSMESHLESQNGGGTGTWDGTLARTAAAAKDLEDIDSRESSSSSKPARESHSQGAVGTQNGTPIDTRNEAANPPAAPIPDPSAPPDPAVFVVEIAVLGRLGRRPNAADRDMIQGWLDAGYSKETIRRAVGDRASTNKAGWKASVMKYYDGVVRDAGEAAAPHAAASAASDASVPPPRALSAEDQAITDLLAPMRAAWWADQSRFPLAPSLDSWKAAMAAGGAVAGLATTWLSTYGIWEEQGCPADLKPPHFSDLVNQRAVFEARMAEVEEGLTNPAPPAGMAH